jgi:hypothetical protein
MAECDSDVCRRIKLQLKKDLAEAKKKQDADNYKLYSLCQKAHASNSTRLLTCPCNAAAMEDIEVAPETECKWSGWSICSNPPCNVLLRPLTLCKKRQCQQFRKSNNVPPVRKPARKRAASAPGKKKQSRSSKYNSDTSSADDSDSGEEPTPRKKLHRRSSQRTTPPKAAVEYSSESSACDGSELDAKPSTPPPRERLKRDVTVTLEDSYEVESIVEGPRKKDGKYLVSWVGYAAAENTWEPKSNLPPSCFSAGNESSSDESGDDEPLYRQILPTLAPDEVLAKAPPPVPTVPTTKPTQATSVALKSPITRTPRLVPEIATRTTFESHRTGLRLRKGKSAK